MHAIGLCACYLSLQKNMFSRITTHLVRIGCMTRRLPTHFKTTRHLHLFCNCFIMFHITGYDFGCTFFCMEFELKTNGKAVLPTGIPSGKSGIPPPNYPGTLRIFQVKLPEDNLLQQTGTDSKSWKVIRSVDDSTGNSQQLTYTFEAMKRWDYRMCLLMSSTMGVPPKRRTPKWLAVSVGLFMALSQRSVWPQSLAARLALIISLG